MQRIQSPDCHVISMQARGRRGLEEGIHARNRRRVDKSGSIIGLLLPSTNPKLDLAIYSREKVMLREREQAYFRAMLLREPGSHPRGVSRSPYQAQPATRGQHFREALAFAKGLLGYAEAEEVLDWFALHINRDICSREAHFKEGN